MRGLLLVALVTLAPLAAAHAIPADLLLESPSGAVPPAGEGALALNATFQWRCAGLARENATQPQSVRFTVDDAPAWANVSVDPASKDLPECDGVGTLPLVVNVSQRDAALPAEPGRLLLTARWLTEGVELGTTAETTLSAAFTLRTNVTAQLSEAKGAPQSVLVFPIVVTNQGNAMAKFSFSVADKSPPINAVVPPSVTLPPGGNATVPFTVQTPYRNGHVSDDGFVTVRVVPSAALDPRLAGDATTLTFRVTTEGWYVPAPGAALGLLAVTAVALTLRRARP